MVNDKEQRGWVSAKIEVSDNSFGNGSIVLREGKPVLVSAAHVLRVFRPNQRIHRERELSGLDVSYATDVDFQDQRVLPLTSESDIAGSEVWLMGVDPDNRQGQPFKSFASLALPAKGKLMKLVYEDARQEDGRMEGEYIIALPDSEMRADGGVETEGMSGAPVVRFKDDGTPELVGVYSRRLIINIPGQGPRLFGIFEGPETIREVLAS